MDKLDHLGWVVSSSYAIGDVRFAVRSTSHAFGEWLSDTLGAYEVDDVEEFLYSVVVPEPPASGRTKEFFILYKGSSAIVRTLDPVTLGRGLLAELEGLRLHERDDAVYVMGSRRRRVPASPSSYPVLGGPGSRSSAGVRRNSGSRMPGQFAVGDRPGDGTGHPVRPIARPARRRHRAPGSACSRGTVATGCGSCERPRTFARSWFRPGTRELRCSRRGRDTLSRTCRVGRSTCEQTGGRACEALGRFVERTPCYESAWTDAGQVITQLAGALKEAS